MPLRLRPRRTETILGHTIPEPRVTPMGRALALYYIGLPLIGALLAFDVAVWAIGRLAFDACLAVWCLF